jgi:dTDP-4-amino-4,6-dideoxygalactose transaminase
LQAAILSVKLPHLDRWNGERRAGAAYYNEQLAGLPGLELPVELPYGEMVYHLYIVKSDRAADIMAAMAEQGIGTALYYPLALHEQEAFTLREGYVKPSLPVAESCDGKTFALPCFPGITREQQDAVVAVVKGALN